MPPDAAYTATLRHGLSRSRRLARVQQGSRIEGFNQGQERLTGGKVKKIVTLAAALAIAGCGSEQPAATQVADSAATAAAQPAAQAQEQRSLSGPFGTEMGMTAADLTARIGQPPYLVENGYLAFNSAPTPHPTFSTYSFVASGKYGLCRVGATATVESSRYGVELRSRFEEIKAALVAKYGTPSNEVDRVLGSTWLEPEDFMMGLVQKERVLVAYWDSEKSPLPNDLGSLLIQADAKSMTSGQIDVTYEYTNFGQCRDELKSKADSAL